MSNKSLKTNFDTHENDFLDGPIIQEFNQENPFQKNEIDFLEEDSEISYRKLGQFGISVSKLPDTNIRKLE